MLVPARLWFARTIHSPSGRLAPLFLSAAFALIGGFPASGAASLRCPGAVIAPPSTPQESAEITSLWRDLALPAASGSDGPLGCPVDQLVQTDGVSGWSGIIQRFQRGFVLIGRGSSSGFEVAAVHGLGGWFVWWKAPPSMNLGDQLMPVGPDKDGILDLLTPLGPGDPLTPGGVPAAQNATWSHGGFVRETTVSASTLSLWRCKVSTCVHPVAISPASWGPVTLTVSALDSWNRPFDAAAKLNAGGLSRPGVTGFAGRVGAVFQDWLPCYTRSPASDPLPTEDTIERAIMMMRGATPCTLTGAVPRSAVDSWLTKFAFPPGHFPGTDISEWPCKRPGDLDFIIIELLHLVHEHLGDLSPGSLANARSILSPWGGAARTDPYITPSGTCLGFNVIETENHLLMQETARYLINSLSGADRVSNRDWILRFLQQFARRDFYEYNSIPYMRFDLKALYVLRDYALDPSVNLAAEGIIDWLFAKQALSANFDRDHRPYRRRPEAKHYAGLAWWGDATIVSVAQAALLAGPLQHVHADFDLELNDGLDKAGTQGIQGLTQLAAYPSLGAAEGSFLAEFTDVADTHYKLPTALQGWFQDRYTDDSANRLTYLQGLHHSSPVADDASLFLQPNHGVELMSGNRNWTIIAGGNAVAPGFPPTPPGGGAWIVGGAIAGAIVGAIVGVLVVGPFGLLAAIIGAILGGVSAADISKAIAAKKQLDGLWSDQPGIMRETTLIPTPVGLDRSQTIRFSQPLVTSQGSSPFSRLCVAEGFLCGFDLTMPNRPFPAADVAPCPLDVSLPAPLAPYRSRTDVNGQPVSSELGCLIKKPNGDVRDWSVWTFEYGVLAIGVGDPPGKQRIAALWIQDDMKGQRIVRLQWWVPGQPHNWFNVHVYNTAVTTSPGEAPAGAILLKTSGDPNNSSIYQEDGDVSFPLEGVQDSSWSLIAEGCLPRYGFLHIRTGHSCRANILPKLALNVAPAPKQSFSCGAHQSVIKDASSPSLSPGQGLVLEVGSSCSSSPYGFFAYVWTAPCTGPYVASSLTGIGSGCPPEANDYGFVIVAPSRGWTWQDFSDRVEVSIASWTAANARSFQPADSPSIDIPISPPVSSTMVDGKLKWTASGPPTSHRVTFRWMGSTPAQGNILADSGAPGVFGPLTLDPEKWPTALGNISAPDVPTGGGRLIHSSGSGCFTVAGIPTPSNPDPVGLLVDLRNASAPVVSEPRSSALPGTCP